MQLFLSSPSVASMHSTIAFWISFIGRVNGWYSSTTSALRWPSEEWTEAWNLQRKGRRNVSSR